MELQRIFEPLQVGPVRLKNRIVRTAHSTGLAPHGPGPELIAYHEARARGGVAMSILEYAAVHPSTGTAGYAVYDDDVIPKLARLADAMRPHDMKVFQQLYYGGMHNAGPFNTPGWSASAVPGPQGHPTPIPMTKDMIAEIIEGYASAARRCRDAGLDGVDIHAAHGYLPEQFLSPLTNRRTDEYGGNLDNRMRFLLELVAAVRAEVGHDIVVGIRMSATEDVPDGLTAEDMRDVALRLEADRQLDYISLTFAGRWSYMRAVAGMDQAQGYQLPDSTLVTRAITNVPRIVVGRIKTLEMAEQLLRDGDADIVSMVRAHIAEPDLMRKAAEHRSSEIRPCIGCNEVCWTGGGHQFIPDTERLISFGCIGNVGAGHELVQGDHLLEPAARPKTVLVAGGGPAGLEAARVAAIRGHRVSLYESGERLGGQVNVARLAPTRSEFGELTDWLASEVSRLGVAIHRDATVDALLVQRERPEVVLIATGSRPRMDGFSPGRPLATVAGTGLPHVVSPHQVLAGDAPQATAAVIYDTHGTYPPVAAAEYLLEAGVHVTFVTRYGAVGTKVHAATMDPARKRLRKLGMTVVTRGELSVIGETEVSVRSLDDDDAELRLPADLVVLWSVPLPVNALAAELAGGNAEIKLIGDALAPRDMVWAIREAHRVAATI